MMLCLSTVGRVMLCLSTMSAMDRHFGRVAVVPVHGGPLPVTPCLSTMGRAGMLCLSTMFAVDRHFGSDPVAFAALSHGPVGAPGLCCHGQGAQEKVT